MNFLGACVAVNPQFYGSNLGKRAKELLVESIN